MRGCKFYVFQWIEIDSKRIVSDEGFGLWICHTSRQGKFWNLDESSKKSLQSSALLTSQCHLNLFNIKSRQITVENTQFSSMQLIKVSTFQNHIKLLLNKKENFLQKIHFSFEVL